jgi:hypothetical protein
MRFSVGVVASALLINAVFAQSVSQDVASASYSVEEAVSYSAAIDLEKRDLFDFLKEIFGMEPSSSSSSDSSSSSASAEPEHAPSNPLVPSGIDDIFAPLPSLVDPFEVAPHKPSEPATPSVGPIEHKKRDGNMQEVLASLANHYYASASIESAALSMAQDEWYNAPEEVASVIAEVSRQRKHYHMKREEEVGDVSIVSGEEESSVSEEDASVSDYYEADVFNPVVSQAYLPVYYRRAKRHLEERGGPSSSEEQPSSASYYRHHHHHEESVSDYHIEESISVDYFDAAEDNDEFADDDSAKKRMLKREESAYSEASADSSYSASDAAESSESSSADKIVKDVQDQIDRALGKSPADEDEFAPVQGNILNQQIEGEFWIADAKAEDQFKGYNWKESN